MKRLAVLLLASACGYQPLYATPSGESFHVHLVKSQIASSVVAEEVLRGARDTLAQEGSLAPGDGYPRLELEVLRVDETSEGIMQSQTSPSPTVFTTVPIARATDLAVVARGWVVRHEGAPMELDTGDQRASALVGAPLGDATREIWQREDGLRAVARRLGGRIVLRILGHPVVVE
jgi:hypothetical protein